MDRVQRGGLQPPGAETGAGGPRARVLAPPATPRSSCTRTRSTAPDCLSRFNGQFAIAIWDSRERSLFLARDRLGVRPLFYTEADGALVFGSEIKAILAASRRDRVPRPGGAGPDLHVLEHAFAADVLPRDHGAAPRPLHARQGWPDHARALLGDGLSRGRRSAPAAHAGVRGGAAGPADRRRADPAAGGRARRRLPERRSGLLDHHGDRPQPDHQPAGDVLHRLHRRALRRERLPAHDGRGPGHRAPRGARHARRHRSGVPGGGLARRDPADEDGAGADVPAVRPGAGQPLQGGPLGRGRRRVAGRLRPLPRGQDPPLLGRAARFRRRAPPCSTRIYPWMPGSSSDFVKAFFGLGLTDTDARDYSHALRWRTTARAKRFFSEDVRRGRRGRRRHARRPPTPTGSTAGAPCSRPSTWRRPSSSRSTCSRPRATGWRWRTPWRGGSPSWTTAWSSSPTSCRRRSSSTGSRRSTC